MRRDKLRYLLRYGVGCSDEQWDTRQAVIGRLRDSDYIIIEARNPCRLTAGKGEEEFIIDILDKDRVGVLPVKWVYGHTDEPVVVTDIPSSGRYGVWNQQSKYYDEVSQLVKPGSL